MNTVSVDNVQEYENYLRKSLGRLEEDWSMYDSEIEEKKGKGFEFRKIPLYSYYPGYSYIAEDENISGITDAVLRKTTKLTESYAGDVLLYLKSFCHAVENRYQFAMLLGFRESGVDCVKNIAYLTDKLLYEQTSREVKAIYAVVPNTNGSDILTNASQVWLLAHVPVRWEKNAVTIFARMSKPHR